MQKGTIIGLLERHDNSPTSFSIPIPNALVVYSEQTRNEVLGGLIDVTLARNGHA